MRALPLVVLVGCATEPAAPPTPVRPPNIILVSLDTTRADHTTPYGSVHDTTPTLARLAEQGTLFTQAFSQSNESAYSHGAMFTGRYASELAEPTYATYGLPDQATLVSEALRAYGYRTGMFSAGGHVTRDYGFDQGWDHARFATGFGSIWASGSAAAKWIEGGPDQPYFVFVHGYDAHRPYSREGFWDHLFADGPGSDVAELLACSPCLSEMVRGDTLYPELVPSWFRHKGGAQVMDPASYDRLTHPPENTVRVPVTEADKAHIQAHYDGSLRYSDTLLGTTLARLEAAGKLENTVVIVTSDHGEDLLDHGYMNHRTGLWDTCTRVPLVVWGPGFEGGHTVDSLVEARDVAATVLALAGALPPAGSGGRDLRAVARGESPIDAVFMEGVMHDVSVRTATHRLLYRGPSLAEADYADQLAAADASELVLYDLRSDPTEQTNIASDQPAVVAELRDRLVAWRRSLKTGAYTLPQDQVSPEAAAAMREHGYWEAGGPPPTTVATSTHTPTPPKGPMDDPDQFCGERHRFLSGGSE